MHWQDYNATIIQLLASFLGSQVGIRIILTMTNFWHNLGGIEWCVTQKFTRHSYACFLLRIRLLLLAAHAHHALGIPAAPPPLVHGAQLRETDHV